MDGIAILKWATLIYAGVLILAVAAVLTTIAVYLWRIAAAASRIREALVHVRDRTEPLKQHLEGLESISDERARRLESAVSTLEESAGIHSESALIGRQVAQL